MQVIEAQDNMPIAGVVALYASLLTFSLQVHPDRLDYVDQILVSFSCRDISSLFLTCLDPSLWHDCSENYLHKVQCFVQYPQVSLSLEESREESSLSLHFSDFFFKTLHCFL